MPTQNLDEFATYATEVNGVVFAAGCHQHHNSLSDVMLRLQHRDMPHCIQARCR
jgi:hypothetical protein